MSVLNVMRGDVGVGDFALDDVEGASRESARDQLLHVEHFSFSMDQYINYNYFWIKYINQGSFCRKDFLIISL